MLMELPGGATVRGAAERAGLSERTAHRRLADTDFRRRVAELRAEMIGRALGRLASRSTPPDEGVRTAQVW